MRSLCAAAGLDQPLKPTWICDWAQRRGLVVAVGHPRRRSAAVRSSRHAQSAQISILKKPNRREDLPWRREQSKRAARSFGVWKIRSSACRDNKRMRMRARDCTGSRGCRCTESSRCNVSGCSVEALLTVDTACTTSADSGELSENRSVRIWTSRAAGWHGSKRRLGMPSVCASDLGRTGSASRCAQADHGRKLTERDERKTSRRWICQSAASRSADRAGAQIDPQTARSAKSTNSKCAVGGLIAARRLQARFAVYGSDIYPAATYTLRMSAGVIKGHELPRQCRIRRCFTDS